MDALLPADTMDGFNRLIAGGHKGRPYSRQCRGAILYGRPLWSPVFAYSLDDVGATLVVAQLAARQNATCGEQALRTP